MKVELPPLLFGYMTVLIALLGLVMGSFLNCAAIRGATGEKISRGRSHCMNCGHTLGAKDLVPVFSWLFLKGKCRYCGAKIAPKYMIAELVGGVVFVSIWLRLGVSLELVEFLIWAGILLWISFRDLEDYIIPDGLIIAGIVLRVVFVLLSDNIGKAALQSLIGGLSLSVPILLVVLLLEKVMKKDAMGGGDLKLLFMTGLYFKWSVNLAGFLFACILGLLSALLLPKLKNAEKQFPFGPAIAAGSWLALLFGEALIRWYMGFFGL